MPTDPLAAPVEALFRDQESHYLTMLREMVGINSFTANPDGVAALGRLTADYFKHLGFAAEHIPATQPTGGPHLVLTRPGRGGRTIGLVSHLDTVFPAEEEARNDFHWRIEGDRIYGPGTVDIKGGTLLIYMMLDALRRLAPDDFDAVTWVILLNSMEETLSSDFTALCRERLGPETLACLVFEGGYYEPGEFWAVVARKGMAVYEVEVTGKAAHAGAAHAAGANAVVQLADVTQQIAGLTDYDKELTFNVGTFDGGTVVNRVPHFARAEVEMRTYDQKVYDAGRARMLAFNDYRSVQSADGVACRVRVNILRETPAWPRNEATERLYALWAATARELGARMVPEERGGLSDGNGLWDFVPTLDGLGPSGGNAHCSERDEARGLDQEYVLATSLAPKALLNTLAVRRLIATAS